MNEQPPILPVENKNRNVSKKHIIFIGVVAACVVLFLCLFFINRARQDADSTPKVSSTILEAYVPKAAKIGSFSVIGACRVFTQNDLSYAFGDSFLSIPNVTNETYQEKSLPNQRLGDDTVPANTECEYISSNSDSNRNVRVSMTQFKTLEERKKKMLDVSNLKAQDETDISNLRTKLKADLSPESDSFLQQAALTVKKFSATSTSSEVDASKLLDGKVLIGVPRTSTAREFSFELYAKNTVISMSFVASNQRREIADINNMEMATIVDSMRRASEKIYANMKDATQLTAPAPTANRKTVPTNDAVDIIDACNLLSSKVFIALTGVEDNTALKRTTFPVLGKEDLSADITNPHRYATVCTKKYDATKVADSYVKTDAENKYGSRGYATVKVEVGHLKNDAAISKAMQPYRAGPKAKLATNADEAYRNSINPNLVVFRKGNYMVFLSVDKMNGAQAELTEAEIIVAINELVSNIR